MTYNPVVITMETGKINADNGSGKCIAFHSPCAGSLRPLKDCKETFLATAVKDCPELAERVSMTPTLAREGVVPEVGGSIYVSTWAIAEHEVIKLFAQGRKGEWNARTNTAVVYIKTRVDAPLNCVHVTVPDGIRNSAYKAWKVMGRFDVLTLKQAREEGVKVLKGCEPTAKQINVDKLFRVEELEAEKRSRARTVNKKVGGRVMRKVVRKRSLDLS